MVFVQTRLLFNMWPPVHRVSNGSKCTTNNNCTKPKHLHNVSKCSPNNTTAIAQKQTTKPQWAQCVKSWSKCCLSNCSPNNNTNAIAKKQKCKKCKR